MSEEVRKIIQNEEEKKITQNRIDAVNGNGPIEEPGFVPTRHELLQLARYWAEHFVDIQFFHFCMKDGSRDPVFSFASRRISRIAELLGDEIVEKVIDDVYEKLSQRHGRAWEVFTNGDDDQKRAFHDEVGRHMSGRRHMPGPGCNSQCKIRTEENGYESHELDWTWIEQETQMHRQGQCSVVKKSWITLNGVRAEYDE